MQQKKNEWEVKSINSKGKRASKRERVCERGNRKQIDNERKMDLICVKEIPLKSDCDWTASISIHRQGHTRHDKKSQINTSCTEPVRTLVNAAKAHILTSESKCRHSQSVRPAISCSRSIELWTSWRSQLKSIVVSRAFYSGQRNWKENPKLSWLCEIESDIYVTRLCLKESVIHEPVCVDTDK